MSAKARVAKFIHQASARRGRPFIAVNCGALPDALFESELFGPVRICGFAKAATNYGLRVGRLNPKLGFAGFETNAEPRLCVFGPSMQRVMAVAARVATVDSNVLIVGTLLLDEIGETLCANNL